MSILHNQLLPLLFQRLHRPRACLPPIPRRPSWETVFGGPDWADSSKHDISLQPKMEHMVTCTQRAAPISGVLSLPVGKKRKEMRAFFSLQLQNGHNPDDINQ